MLRCKVIVSGARQSTSEEGKTIPNRITMTGTYASVQIPPLNNWSKWSVVAPFEFTMENPPNLEGLKLGREFIVEITTDHPHS